MESYLACKSIYKQYFVAIVKLFIITFEGRVIDRCVYLVSGAAEGDRCDGSFTVALHRGIAPASVAQMTYKLDQLLNIFYMIIYHYLKHIGSFEIFKTFRVIYWICYKYLGKNNLNTIF